MSNFDVDVLLPNQGGLFIYDWSHVRAQPFAYSQYCLGGGPCELPETQNQGVISLELSQVLTYALAQRALNLRRFDFMVSTDGDDNPSLGDDHPSLDCTYTAFTMEIQVEYVLP